MRTALLVAIAALTTACVADPLAAAMPEDTDVAVVAEDLHYAPEHIEVVAGQATTIHLRNGGALVHDLALENGWRSGEVRPGEAVRVTLSPLDATTVAWCSVPGHRDAGMELRITVVEDRS